MTLLGVVPFVVLLVGAYVSRFGRTADLAALGVALAAMGFLAHAGRAANVGTFDADPFSLFLGGVLVLLLTLSRISEPRREPGWKSFGIGAAMLLVVSTRSMLWVYIGFEAFTLLTVRRRARSVGSSVVALSGLLLVATGSGTVDLAMLDGASVGSRLGFLLFSAGIAAKWLFASADTGFGSLGAGIALASFWIRAVSWAPELPPVWIPAGLACILVGGVGSALSGRTPAFLAWLGLSQFGVTALGISGGAPSLPHVMSHVAVSTVSILLVSRIVHGEETRSPAALLMLALSLASVPPLPGFVTKVGVFAALPPAALVVALVGSFLVGVGCTRLVARATAGSPSRTLTAAAVVLVIACIVFPDALFVLATRAATGLF